MSTKAAQPTATTSKPVPTRLERAMSKNLLTSAWGAVSILFKTVYMTTEFGIEVAAGEMDILAAKLEAERLQRDADAKQALEEAKSFFN